MRIALLCAITGKYYLHNQSLNELLFRSSETNRDDNAKGTVLTKLKRHLQHNKAEPMQKLAPNRRTNNTLHNDPDADHVYSPISFAARRTCLYINRSPYAYHANTFSRSDRFYLTLLNIGHVNF